MMTAENAIKTKCEEKRQTRRVPRQVIVPDWACQGMDGVRFDWGTYAVSALTRSSLTYIPAYLDEITQYAKHQAGDLCWIAEPYRIANNYCNPQPCGGLYVRGFYGDNSVFAVTLVPSERAKFQIRKYPFRYSPGRFMYKSLARTIVEIKRVWTEQVQDISDEDAYAEGITKEEAEKHWYDGPQPVSAFMDLWNSINKRRGYGWDTNPWVYAYEYELVKVLR